MRTCWSLTPTAEDRDPGVKLSLEAARWARLAAWILAVAVGRRVPVGGRVGGPQWLQGTLRE